MKKDSFEFKRFYYEAIQSLGHNERLELYDAIFDFVFCEDISENEIQLEGASQAIFILITGYISGKLKDC